MAFCNMCGAQVPDGTTTCAACAGRVPAGAAAPVAASAGGMADNVAGMLAYITIIPAIIFLVMEPYNKNRFVRFHAWQNIFSPCGCNRPLDHSDDPDGGGKYRAHRWASDRDARLGL